MAKTSPIFFASLEARLAVARLDLDERERTIGLIRLRPTRTVVMTLTPALDSHNLDHSRRKSSETEGQARRIRRLGGVPVRFRFCGVWVLALE